MSSTGHLTIAEKLLGLQIDDPGVTAFKALIQVGAIAAVLLHFRRDITTLAAAWFRGLTNPAHRQRREYHLAWYVIVGSLPVGMVSFLAQNLISGPLRNLWVVAAGLLVWSAVMFLAERIGTKTRGEDTLRRRDAIVIGAVHASPSSPASPGQAPQSVPGCSKDSTGSPPPDCRFSSPFPLSSPPEPTKG